MTTGRPLRFLIAVIAGWIGVRGVLLWPDREPPKVGEPLALVPIARDLPVLASAAAVPTRTMMLAVLVLPKKPAFQVDRTYRAAPPQIVLLPSVSAAVIAQTPAKPSFPTAPIGSLPSPLGLPDHDAGSRWSGGVFAIARPSGTGGGLGSSQLGGSQLGARLAYALGRNRRIALVGRVATPVEGRGREAGLGVEWRMAGLPIRVFAEQRFALDGGKGGPSLGVIAGVDRSLGRGFRLEAYGQAGAIRRDRAEGFADGAARVTRRIARVGSATLDAGVGAWGAVQRNAERLDLGPTVGLAAPVGGRTLRLTLDWRERVAGAARPGSGPALSLGTDF